jgi:hypothetical protein
VPHRPRHLKHIESSVEQRTDKPTTKVMRSYNGIDTRPFATLSQQLPKLKIRNVCCAQMTASSKRWKQRPGLLASDFEPQIQVVFG